MKVEICIQGDGEELRRFYQGVIGTLGNFRPDYMYGTANPQKLAEKNSNPLKEDRIISTVQWETQIHISTSKGPGLLYGKFYHNMQLFLHSNLSKIRELSSLCEFSQWQRANQNSISFLGTGNEESSFRATRTASQGIRRTKKPTPFWRHDKTPVGFAIIAATMDTIQNGVGKRLESKKSKRYQKEWWRRGVSQPEKIITNVVGPVVDADSLIKKEYRKRTTNSR